MVIPNLLEVAIEDEVNKYNIKELKCAALNLSKRYMEAERNGESLLKNELDIIAYSVIRMPATYSAIKTCLDKIKELYDCVNQLLLIRHTQIFHDCRMTSAYITKICGTPLTNSSLQ